MKYKFYYNLKWFMEEKTGTTLKLDHIKIVELLLEWKQNHKGEKFDFKVKPDEYCGYGTITVRTNKNKMDTVIMLDSFLGKYASLTWK